jgi:hypothetical protein
LNFYAVNTSNSVYSSLSISSSKFKLTSNNDNNSIPEIGYKISLNHFLSFLIKLTHLINRNIEESNKSSLVFIFNPYYLIVLNESDKEKNCLNLCRKFNFESVTPISPFHLPFDEFVIHICGLGPEWFEMLLAAASPSGKSLKQSQIIIQIDPTVGIKFILDPSNDDDISCQVIIGHYNLQNFKYKNKSKNTCLIVSLLEFFSIFNLAKQLNSMISIFITEEGE